MDTVSSGVDHVPPAERVPFHVVEQLEAYIRAFAAFHDQCFNHPTPGSELARALTDEAAFAPFEIAGTFLDSGLDHLGTVEAALGANRLPRFSCFTLARTCVEASARAAWLLDRNIGGRERVARSLAERVEVAHRLHEIDGNADRLDEMHAAVCGIAATQGIRVRCSKSHPAYGFDSVQRPKATTVIKEHAQRVLDQTKREGLEYKVLSGFAHAGAHMWLMSSVPSGQLIGGRRGYFGRPPTELILTAVQLAARLHAGATELLAARAGIDGPPAAPHF